MEQLKNGKLEAKEWPYSYSQRLRALPRADGTTINQLDTMLEKLAEDPDTRRAVALTGVPEIDNFTNDPPCLREIQLRCTEVDNVLRLHMMTSWRSRDLWRAWPDNVIALTFLQQSLARDLGKRMGREVNVGSYSEDSRSLHLYGQCMNEFDINGKYLNLGSKDGKEVGESVIMKRAWTSEKARDNLVVSQLQELLGEETWNFPDDRKEIISGLIRDLESGELLA